MLMIMHFCWTACTHRTKRLIDLDSVIQYSRELVLTYVPMLLSNILTCHYKIAIQLAEHVGMSVPYVYLSDTTMHLCIKLHRACTTSWGYVTIPTCQNFLLLMVISVVEVFYKFEVDGYCLLIQIYNTALQVIANSTSLLNPSDVIKLLNFLLSMVQSR